MTAPYPRIIIEVSGGKIDAIRCDGVDLTHIPVLVMDSDIDSADEGETVFYGDDEVLLSVEAIEVAKDEHSRNARRAYDNWELI